MGNQYNRPPLLSVLMPVFNGEKHLCEAIDSILNQTFADFEFLIINDGSSDRTREIILSYSDSRIRLIDNDENLGLARSLNKGIALAQGKYIARMDGDDISLPQRFSYQVQFMENHPDIAVSGTWVETFDASSAVWRYPLCHEEMSCALLFQSVLAHPSVIMRKFSLAENHFEYSQSFHVTQDYDLWVRISQKCRLANIDKILLKYRMTHSGRLSNFVDRRIIEDGTIRRSQLERLLFRDISPIELDLHNKISEHDFEHSLEFLKRVEAWFEEMILANKRNLFYDTSRLIHALHQYWWVCNNHLFAAGLNVWPIYKNSSLRMKRLPVKFRIKEFIMRGRSWFKV